MKKMVSLVSCIMAGFLLSVNGCDKKEAKTDAERMVNVKTVKAEVKPLRPFIEAVGSLYAYEEVIVSAEIDGILKELRVDNGTLLTKGQIMAGIEDIDYALEVRRAEAALRQTEATLANTQVEFKRKEALLKEELITLQQFDDVSTRQSLAVAEVERAKASLSLAQQRLIKTRIYSPISGVVKEKKVERGNFVKNGTPLFTVIQTNPLKLNFMVPERVIDKLRIGQEVIFSVDAMPDREFKGKVTIVYPSVDERTRTLQVEAQVPNPDGLLKPGLFARIVLYTGDFKDTVIVPIIAPLFERDIVKLFVIEGDRAREIRPKTGLKRGEFIEILEGVKPGDNVVVAGQQNLAEGVKVNIAGRPEPNGDQGQAETPAKPSEPKEKAK